MRQTFALTILFALVPATLAQPASDSALALRVQAIDKLVNTNVADLVGIYKEFHRHPELSLKEEHSAARLAKEAKAARIGRNRKGRRERRGCGIKKRPRTNGADPNGYGCSANRRTDWPSLCEQGPDARSRTAATSASCTRAGTMST